MGKQTPKLNSDSNNHPAVRMLFKFFAEMNAWELGFIGRDFKGMENSSAEEVELKVEQYDKRDKAKLLKIFEKYCEAGKNAERIKDTLHSGGYEPDYNPDTEKILEVTDLGDKVIVETLMAHNFKFRLKYELIKRGNNWLVCDNRKCKGDFNKGWKQWYL